jgi:hypothetical protein
MDPVFTLEEETPLAYFEKIVAVIYTPHYARHLRKIGARYDRDVIPEDLDLMPFIIDALIFDTYINGKTPLDDFIAFFKPQLTPARLRIYQQFRQRNQLSAFQVRAVERPETLHLTDLIDDSEWVVKDNQALRFLYPDSFTISRLLPWENGYVLSGSCALLNHKEPEAVIHIARSLKLPPLMLTS